MYIGECVYRECGFYTDFHIIIFSSANKHLSMMWQEKRFIKLCSANKNVH